MCHWVAVEAETSAALTDIIVSGVTYHGAHSSATMNAPLSLESSLSLPRRGGCEDKETRACCPSLELSTTLAEIFRLHQHIIKANRWAAPGTWLQLIALRRLIQQKSTTAQTASFWAVLTKSASISQPCRPSLRKYSNIVQRMFAYFSQTNFRQQQMMLRLLSMLARNSFLHPGQYIPMKQSIRGSRHGRYLSSS